MIEDANSNGQAVATEHHVVADDEAEFRMML
jgi:hypothetical protein